MQSNLLRADGGGNKEGAVRWDKTAKLRAIGCSRREQGGQPRKALEGQDAVGGAGGGGLTQVGCAVGDGSDLWLLQLVHHDADLVAAGRAPTWRTVGEDGSAL